MTTLYVNRFSLDQICRVGGRDIRFSRRISQFGIVFRDTRCLIFDVRIPKMNGLELQRQLTATHFEIPVVFITVYGDEPTRSQAISQGAADYLLKPFSEEALLTAIDAALSRNV